MTATAVTGVQAQTPDYEPACRLTPACMALLASLGATADPAPTADAVLYEPAYTDAELAGAIDISWDDDLDRIMHSCNANIGGFWNQLSQVLPNEEGQPLREFRIHGQPPLSRVAQEADFARRASSGKPMPDDVRDLVGDDVFTIWAEPDAEGDMRTAACRQPASRRSS